MVPCVPSGLAKMSMFVLFSRLFGHFESFAFFRKWGGGGGGQTLHQSSQTGCFGQGYFE